MFETLTKYIPKLQSKDFGEWIIDQVNDGSREHPIQFPFVNYSQIVYQLENDLFEFCEQHPEFEYTNYGGTLEANGIEWGTESMESAEVSKLDAKTIIALLVGACRAERFCDGALLGFLKDGAIERWLVRLNELDKGKD